jgi:hypothetical protein
MGHARQALSVLLSNPVTLRTSSWIPAEAAKCPFGRWQPISLIEAHCVPLNNNEICAADEVQAFRLIHRYVHWTFLWATHGQRSDVPQKIPQNIARLLQVHFSSRTLSGIARG